jgi:hypothetical protein
MVFLKFLPSVAQCPCCGSSGFADLGIRPFELARPIALALVHEIEVKVLRAGLHCRPQARAKEVRMHAEELVDHNGHRNALESRTEPLGRIASAWVPMCLASVRSGGFTAGCG